MAVAIEHRLLFVEIYNAEAARLGLPLVSAAVAVGALQDTAFWRAIERLTSGIAAHRAAQRRRARLPRGSPIARKLRDTLAGAEYTDWSARELWDEFIGFAKVAGLTIRETTLGQRLEWDDTDNDKCGELTFAAFRSDLSRRRQKRGALRYARAAVAQHG